MNRTTSLLLAAALALAACDPKEKAQDIADRAASGASDLKSDAKSAAMDKVDDTKSAALSEIDKGLLAAKTKLFGLTDTGSLSE